MPSSSCLPCWRAGGTGSGRRIPAAHCRVLRSAGLSNPRLAANLALECDYWLDLHQSLEDDVATSGRERRISARRGPRPPAADPPGCRSSVRPVRRGDLERVIAIDATVTGIAKRNYWRSVYERYGEGGRRRASVPGRRPRRTGRRVRHRRGAGLGVRLASLRLGVRDRRGARRAPGRHRHPPARRDLRELPPRRRAQGAHDALARQHADPVLLPQPGNDGRRRSFRWKWISRDGRATRDAERRLHPRAPGFPPSGLERRAMPGHARCGGRPSEDTTQQTVRAAAPEP